MSKSRFVLQVHVGAFSKLYEALSVEASKQTTAQDIVACISEKLGLSDPHDLELAEVVENASGQECKERRLGAQECPVALQLLWPHVNQDQHGTEAPSYRFCLREKLGDHPFHLSWPAGDTDAQLIRDYFLRFLYQPKDKEYTDLCQLPDLTEQTLLENLKARFEKGHIYTYVGSILIAVNPFKFYPIYNPKYVGLYQNRRLGDLPPHIFAIADAAYHVMLHERKNQCIVISGESGSGKTESTNLLLHHLTALSQKGSYGRGVEQTILSAGPVLEAFGNAKTKHNNNSSRFGKFIQVNYKENGMVHGAVVQKYLLEKSRIVSQAKKERNYHVFYYLLAGASDAEKKELRLTKPDDYHYLNQSQCYTLEGDDEAYELARLKQSMEMVGFSQEKQKKLFRVLSAVLHLGNIEFSKKSTYHSDEAVQVKNPEVLSLISAILGVKEETLNSALTTKRAKTPGETLVISYKMPEAIATRDAMAKCLYGALFDWIVMQVNHALLSAKDLREHRGNSIGVLDIFGFEDFGDFNSFEQFCINFANEHLQYYFNQHVFKYEQEEYQKEGIQWKNIEFMDNTGCLSLIEGRPHGLLCLLDDQCNFSGATSVMLLQKFQNHHKNNSFFESPQKRENAFLVKHYAGKVKYQIKDFKEKNLDLMRPDVVMVLKSSSLSFVRELVGVDPVAVFRWAILRAFFRAYSAFVKGGKALRMSEGGGDRGLKKAVAIRSRLSHWDENCISRSRSPRKSAGRSPLSALNVNTPLLPCPGNGGAKSCPLHGLETILCASEARVLERANQIMMKNKSSRSRTRMDKGLKNLQTVKTVVGRTHTFPQRTGRKQPPTVTAQFQVSLCRLMEALNQANPFFVRCIKSNADKVPSHFNESVILQQLRYTGMLETVRIRQSGYSVRLTFEEFIQRYRPLLPKGLLSSQTDIRDFLLRMNLDCSNYQMGKTKVFFRESEKLKLDEYLHLAILKRIITLQRHIRTWIARRSFVMKKAAAVIIQRNVRKFLVRCRIVREQERNMAALCIQRTWRQYRGKLWLVKLRRSCVHFQSCCRGYLVRLRFREMLVEHRQKWHQKRNLELLQSVAREQSGQLEIELGRSFHNHRSVDSEESSGIHEDSENDSLVSEGGTMPLSPPFSPMIDHSIPPHSQGQTRKEPQFKSHENLFQKFSTSSTSLVPPRSRDQKVPIRKCLSEVIPDDAMLNKKRIPSGSILEGADDLHLGKDVHPFQDSNLPHKGPLYKAKKHLKTFIGSKKDKKESREETDDSDMDDAITVKPSGLCIDPMPEEIKPSHTDHTIQKISMRYKGEVCSVCERSMSLFINQGCKCTRCKLLFHPKCVHLAEKFPCKSPNFDAPSRPRKQRKPSKASELQQKQQQQPGSWNVTRTAEFKDPGDILITDVSELKNLDSFLLKKVGHLNESGKKRDSRVDIVFKKALKEFKSNLISTYSAASQDGRLCLQYKDLTDHFLQVVNSVIAQEAAAEAFPKIMAVNAFRGFLDEFRNLYRNESKPKSKGKKRKRKKQDQVIEHSGHVFISMVINIPTACEVCSSSMWLTEKGLVCQACKLTCHKKCYQKVSVSCRDAIVQQGRRVFGAPLDSLVNDEMQIPYVVEKLITAIELKGLYTEGIYRKSGITSKVAQLKQLMDDDAESVDLDGYSIHVLTATLKAFFREMPEPLMTFELYDDFLWATEIQDPEERIQAIFVHAKKLPRAHFDLFERLVFHLARVAQHEEANRMSPESLAIVFAPCILRTNKRLQAQDSLSSVTKQTICVKCIINEQLQKVKNMLADIDTLDTACHTASTRLSSLRSSRFFLAQEFNGNQTPVSTSNQDDEMEEAILAQQIENLQKEKALLTDVLPKFPLTLSGSDDDLLSTDLDSAAGSLDDVRASHCDDSHLNCDATAPSSGDTKHPKSRVSTPLRRLQPRFPNDKVGSLSTPKQTLRRTDNSIVSLYQPVDVDDDDAIIV